MRHARQNSQAAAAGSTLTVGQSMETLSLFSELEVPGELKAANSIEAPHSSPPNHDPLVRAQKLAKKMPYLPKKRGERQRAGKAICRLLLASLHESGSTDNRH